jgi:aminomuconate-semialdehyde/2-hydroxymuconate-6-semialdehyde dehydrogenase
VKTFTNYIGGEFTASAQWLPVFNPATGEQYAAVAESSLDDVNAALEASRAAFRSWSMMPARERAGWLRKLAAAIASKQEAFAQAETQDTGKPIRLSSTVDIPRSIHNFEFFADAATQFSSESHHDTGMVNYTLRQPLGPVVCISPWNLPLYLLSWKIAPALAAGNTVVAKPSEVTPHTAFLLSKACQETGFPKGVLNILHGSGAKVGNWLVDCPDFKAVSFTGSTAIGRQIAEKAGRALRKVSLELGGKNPFVVFDDCDWERTLDTAARACFSNQGQICLAASRILVQASVFDKFKDDLLKRTAKLVQGDPASPGTDQGAVVSKAHFEKILQALETARSEGARVLCGGNARKMTGPLQNGWFIEPTLLEGLPMNSRTNSQEIFGPVATLQSFTSEAQALELANQSQYGLSASLWTQNTSRVMRFSDAMRAGIVWVNCWMLRDLRTPFGGVKESGLGREGGWDAMRFFTESKNVCIAE